MLVPSGVSVASSPSPTSEACSSSLALSSCDASCSCDSSWVSCPSVGVSGESDQNVLVTIGRPTKKLVMHSLPSSLLSFWGVTASGIRFFGFLLSFSLPFFLFPAFPLPVDALRFAVLDVISLGDT